jgi:hypothetical protein
MEGDTGNISNINCSGSTACCICIPTKLTPETEFDNFITLQQWLVPHVLQLK